MAPLNHKPESPFSFRAEHLHKHTLITDAAHANTSARLHGGAAEELLAAAVVWEERLAASSEFRCRFASCAPLSLRVVVRRPDTRRTPALSPTGASVQLARRPALVGETAVRISYQPIRGVPAPLTPGAAAAVLHRKYYIITKALNCNGTLKIPAESEFGFCDVTGWRF